MSALFSPMVMRGLTLPNRIVVSPMCQYCATDGLAGTWHLVHLGGLALSGAGMLIIEATAVEPAGRITPGDLGLWDDSTEDALKAVVDVIKAHSNIPVTLQLAHAGRKASSDVPWNGGRQIREENGGWLTKSASPLPHQDGETPPVALDHDALYRIKEAFVTATQRAERIGVDAIEIHAAHGYLLHQFLSPLSNSRTDEYGGSIENRMRFPLEVFDAVRQAMPANKPVGMRVSATDWVGDGWSIDDTVIFAKALASRGVDWIDVSSGGASPHQKISVGPGYQVSFAERIKQEVDVPVIAVGLITDPQQAEDIIKAGQADFVAVGRGMLNDPRWPWRAAATLGGSVTAPAQYWRSLPRGTPDIFGESQTRPADRDGDANRTRSYAIAPSRVNKAN